jgi:hypothetical protein
MFIIIYVYNVRVKKCPVPSEPVKITDAIAAFLVMKFSVFYEVSRSITQYAILSHLNLVHTFTSHFHYVQLNVIFASTPTPLK